MGPERLPWGVASALDDLVERANSFVMNPWLGLAYLVSYVAVTCLSPPLLIASIRVAARDARARRRA